MLVLAGKDVRCYLGVSLYFWRQMSSRKPVRSYFTKGPSLEWPRAASQPRERDLGECIVSFSIGLLLSKTGWTREVVRIFSLLVKLCTLYSFKEPFYVKWLSCVLESKTDWLLVFETKKRKIGYGHKIINHQRNQNCTPQYPLGRLALAVSRKQGIESFIQVYHYFFLRNNPTQL